MLPDDLKCLKLVKDGTMMTRGLRLQRISQNWLHSHSFLSIHIHLSHGRMRWAIAHVCWALRAQTLGGHARLSITVEAWFCWCNLVDYKISLLGITVQESHLGSLTFQLALDIGKMTRKYPREVFWPLSFRIKASFKRWWFHSFIAPNQMVHIILLWTLSCFFPCTAVVYLDAHAILHQENRYCLCMKIPPENREKWLKLPL